jgi:MFS superfamily sulfate permease-like transporter
MLAIITGAYLLLARLLRLGFIANFLSRSVLVGFLSGVGIQVACGQFPGLFGLTKAGKGPVQQVANTFRHIGSASLSTLAVALVVLVVISLGGRLAPRLPWALGAVVGAITVSAAFGLAAHGVATLGATPRGLPHLALPTIPSGDYVKLATTAASIFVVVLAQSAATSRAYAAKFDDSFDENVDLIGLGLANIAAGLSGTFVVNGSPTKTAMVDKAGGRSQLAQLTTAAIVLVVLVALTKPLSYLPEAVLSAVVFLIAIGLVDLAGLRLLRQRRPVEFVVALLTAATVVLLGVEQGIVVGIVLSIIIHLRHSYRPLDLLMAPARGGDWKAVPLQSNQQLAPGLMAYHFGAGLYYANTGRFAEEVRALVDGAEPPLEWFCLVADAVRDVDFSGSLALRATYDALVRRKVDLVLCQVSDPVRAELERDGLIDAIGTDRLFETIADVVEAFKARPQDPEHDPRPPAEATPLALAGNS